MHTFLAPMISAQHAIATTTSCQCCQAAAVLFQKQSIRRMRLGDKGEFQTWILVTRAGLASEPTWSSAVLHTVEGSQFCAHWSSNCNAPKGYGPYSGEPMRRTQSQRCLLNRYLQAQWRVQWRPLLLHALLQFWEMLVGSVFADAQEIGGIFEVFSAKWSLHGMWRFGTGGHSCLPAFRASVIP